jgi:hypothetical protein
MRGIGKMGIGKGYRFGMGILLGIVLVLAAVLTAVAVAPQAAPENPGRADVITIDGLNAFGPLERPAVLFFHDKHTDALAKQNQTCTACHETTKNGLSQKFKRVQDTNKEMVMEIYHDQCISCHKQSGKSGRQSSGPVTCGECHVKDPKVQSTRQPMALDKSLHYRHVKANNKKCDICHHQYNPGTKTLYYEKGKEGACLYCHKQQTQENRISSRLASHQSCVACHYGMTAQNQDAGPVRCSGCHDPEQQALFEKVSPIPRMERGQPDVVMVKTGLEQAGIAAGRMPPVPFDHKAHEGYNDTCRQCHHAGLQSCATCHTVEGSKESRQVKLAQAMHQNGSGRSCVGCHGQQQAQPQCIGCHSSISKRRSLAGEASCKSCHMDGRVENPLPVEGTGQSMAAAADLLLSRTPTTGTIAPDQIPETVTIQVLAKSYEGVVLPHRKIVQSLAQGMKDNRLANYFHTDPTVLCQGCHHQSPVSAKPPLCGSCHGRSSEALNLSRPGLMAAYHQQCIQCHDMMGLEKPASRECTACHAKRK